jgi:hypothetical protein
MVAEREEGDYCLFFYFYFCYFTFFIYVDTYVCPIAEREEDGYCLQQRPYDVLRQFCDHLGHEIGRYRVQPQRLLPLYYHALLMCVGGGGEGARARAFIYVFMYACKFVHVCTNARMYVCMYVCVCVCKYLPGQNRTITEKAPVNSHHRKKINKNRKKNLPGQTGRELKMRHSSWSWPKKKGTLSGPVSRSDCFLEKVQKKIQKKSHLKSPSTFTQ